MGRWDSELIALLPASVKLFASAGAGYDWVDVDILAKSGIIYCNGATASSEAVADMAVYHIISVFRNMQWTNTAGRSGDPAMFLDAHRNNSETAHNPKGHTLGIIGLGNIGYRIAQKAFAAFGMKIAYADPIPKPAKLEAAIGATRYADLDALLAVSDCVVISAPGSAEGGKALIDSARLARMKKGSRLVNVGRGNLVDGDALADALESGHLVAAGLDVHENEPYVNPRLLALRDKIPTRAREPWHMAEEVHRRSERDEESGEKPRRLGVSRQNLTVKGTSSNATFNENVVSQFYPFHKDGKSRPLKTIIDNSSGCVKTGEMLLVLGRPGSGCTTLLSVLSNNRLGSEEITGNVSFGTMTAEEAKIYRGQIIMNTEEEISYPTLTFEDTINFAARNKIPHHLPPARQQYVQDNKDFLLRLAGISHTNHMKVGDAFTRGVSGGGRKRVSILECLTTRASVFCWDNSTRGLDASTALEWIKAMRVMTDMLGLTTIVTLYQAGNGIYEHFDIVLVLDEGKQIYYGPRQDAVPFMESLGFLRESGSNSADFLTGVTVPTERRIATGFEQSFPRTADEVLAAYDRSPIKPKMLEECLAYPSSQEAVDNTALFRESVAHEKHNDVSASSPVTANFPTQVWSAIIRQYQIMLGDKATLILQQAATLTQSLISASLFYAAPDNSAGLFIKGGTPFFSILYHA
ncbi:hypothetical protein INS49_004286 [Diaporthe citri]|uniref:uncharacterized protein n=1 Tax=Diaporthe citri TaxID=83186 RepID=UPI001C7EDAF1|nr:uncharacterized protein INS49_004286 [Diaporthe citri]KAG6355205.1 hypothetical protein INS49_004286 [Diaporthe citri]